MASPNLSEIITTTLRNRTGKLADNVTDNNALLYRLKQRGKVKPPTGCRFGLRRGKGSVLIVALPVKAK